MNHLSDEQLVESCLKGNMSHGKLLYKRYERRIEYYVSKKVSIDDVEDCVQEIFIRAFNRLGQYKNKNDAKFSTWLFTIATHACYDYWRKHRQKNEVPLEIPVESKDGETWEIPFPSPNPGPDDLLYRKELKDMINKALNRLSEKERTVALLGMVQEFSYEEISEITGIPKGTVGSMLFNIKRKLKGDLN